MTLAEIREILLRELAVSALSSRVDFKSFERGGPRFGLLRRVGKPLVLRHVRRGQRILWHGLYAKLGREDRALVVERVEPEQVMFDSPRLVISMTHFLNAVAKGSIVDA